MTIKTSARAAGRKRISAGAAFVGALLALPGSAWAGGNFPPVADAAASPQEVLLGEVVAFSSDASFDPDDGPAALSFVWDFGDGQQSTLPNPTHLYAALGVHIVTLTVADGATQSLVTLAVVTLPPPTATRPSSSGPLALTADDTLLVVANPDADSVSFVNTASMAVTEVSVCDQPRNVAWAPDDSRVFVTCFGSDELWSLGPDGTMIASIPTGREPFGVAVIPTTGEVVVANYGEASLDVFDPELADSARVLVDRGPRALAIAADGGAAHVTHFLNAGDAATITTIALDPLAVREVVSLSDDPGPDTSSSGRGVPNVLAAIAIDPAGTTTWTGAIKANTGRGPFLNGEDLQPRNRLRGVLAPFDPLTGIENVVGRIDTNDADGVSAIAFSPRGRYAYVTHQGADRLSVYDVPAAALVDTGDGSAVNVESRVDTGSAPHGIVVSSDGSVAYVANALSRDISVFDLADLRSPALREVVAVANETLDATVARGKRHFFASREPVYSDQNYIACASCHPDGGPDGRTWDFTQFGEGLRNTIDLRGRSGTGHGPVHWTANFNEIQDFENDIQGGFGGEGLLGGEAPHPPLSDLPNGGRSFDLDALAAYVSSLDSVPKSPHREASGALTASAQRGYDVFFDPATRCADCHVPPAFTDSRLTEDPSDFIRHLVGTQGEGSGMGLGRPLVGFDTPTVLGVWATAPYLHDGSAPTLRDVLTVRNPRDEHGATSQLSEAEIDDLVAYLLSLQGSSDEHPELPGSETDDGTGSSGEGSSSGDASMTEPADGSSTSPSSSGTSGNDGTTSAAGSEGSATDDAAQTSSGGCGCNTSSPTPTVWLIFFFAFAGLSHRRQRES